MSYASISDLNRYLENFATNYYGSRDGALGTIAINLSLIQSDLNSSFEKINSMLDSLNIVPVIPVGTSLKTGSYNPFLVEWNCCDTIYNKLKSRHYSEFKEDFPSWMVEFGSRGLNIFTDIMNGKITLDMQTTEKGIGYPEKVRQSGVAQFHSNWDSGYYTASDYKKTFHFKITSLANGSSFGQARFRVSSDGGFTWNAQEFITGTNWIPIANGLEIRWSPVVSGTMAQFGSADEWRVTCIPMNVISGGYSSRFKTFKVG